MVSDMRFLEISELQHLAARPPDGNPPQEADLLDLRQKIDRLSGYGAEDLSDQMMSEGWRIIEKQGLEIIARCWDLRVAVGLAQASSRRSFQAFADALCFILLMIEEHWATLQPKIENGDGGVPDLLPRLSCLTSLADNRTTLANLRYLPLCGTNSTIHPMLTMRTIDAFASKARCRDGERVPGPAELEAAFAAADPGEMAETQKAIARASGYAGAIAERFARVAEEAGDDQAVVRLDALLGLLSSLETTLTDWTAKEAGRAAVLASSSPTPSSPFIPEFSGEQKSAERRRADIISTLNKICEEYEVSEPSSPVPLLLKRASRLVGKGYLHIQDDLTPSGRDEAEKILKPG